MNKKQFQVFILLILSLVSIIAFQNCSPLKGSYNLNSGLVGNLRLSSKTNTLESPAAEFCARIINKEIDFKLNFGDPLVLDVQFSNNCDGPVKVVRKFVSENEAGLFVRQPNEEAAFVGQSFSLEAGQYVDQLFVSSVNNYGETLLTMNYSLTYQAKTVSIPVRVVVKTEFPKESIVISENKITCKPEAMAPESYLDAFQIRYADGDPRSGQWSPCIVTKCADGFYFNKSGGCESITPTRLCPVSGEYTWGSSTLPTCRGSLDAFVEVGSSAQINNIASGYRGTLKLNCEWVESEKTVSQEAGKFLKVKVSQPTLRPDYDKGSDSKISTTCLPTEFKGCLAFEESIFMEGTDSIDGEDFLFVVPSIAHGDNIFVTGKSQSNPSHLRKQIYACLNGIISRRIVSDDYKLPGINISVKNVYQDSGARVLNVTLWRAEHLNNCLIEVTTSKGIKQRATIAVGNGTYNYSFGLDTITADDGEVYIYCEGNQSTRVFNIPYFGLKK